MGLDPSTKTGIVILDEDGEVWEAREIEETGQDPERMSRLIHSTCKLLQPGDQVAIEGFGFASQTGFLLGGIGWGIRINLHQRGIPYVEAAPTALKKFTGAKGNAGKETIAVEVFKRWGFQHKSNNVTDAYVLAQLARGMHEPIQLTRFQEEVINKVRGC